MTKNLRVWGKPTTPESWLQELSSVAWTYGNNHHLLGYNNPRVGTAPEHSAVLQALRCGQSLSS